MILPVANYTMHPCIIIIHVYKYHTGSDSKEHKLTVHVVDHSITYRIIWAIAIGITRITLILEPYLHVWQPASS